MSKMLSPPGLLLPAALGFLAAPGEPLAASECGPSGEVLCSETTSCIGFWKWWSCRVTSSTYYQEL